MNGWSDYKVVLSDLTAFDLIYLPLYFHIFRYFILFSITDFSKTSAQAMATLVRIVPLMSIVINVIPRELRGVVVMRLGVIPQVVDWGG